MKTLKFMVSMVLYLFYIGGVVFLEDLPVSGVTLLFIAIAWVFGGYFFGRLLISNFSEKDGGE